MATREAYYSGQSTFNVQIPSIYSVELASYCNYRCDFCPRGQYPDAFINFGLAETISERDLGGSRFIEFQLTGEPTFHKRFNELVALFKGKVLVGTSTNGSNVVRALEGLLMLDYITISVDSVSNYEQVRLGGKSGLFFRNLQILLEAKGDNPFPRIDLQLIEFERFEMQKMLLQEWLYVRGLTHTCTIRTVPESFSTISGKAVMQPKRELCLNPWLSVVVQVDGDVVPCCLSFGKEIVYGNLNEQSLEEIWHTSPRLAQMRDEHMNNQLPSPCDRCYMRSPCLLHDELIWEAMKDKVLGG